MGSNNRKGNSMKRCVTMSPGGCWCFCSVVSCSIFCMWLPIVIIATGGFYWAIIHQFVTWIKNGEFAWFAAAQVDAKGVFAIGQAWIWGIVAIGQVAFGCCVFGQVAVGFCTIGMVPAGFCWFYCPCVWSCFCVFVSLICCLLSSVCGVAVPTFGCVKDRNKDEEESDIENSEESEESDKESSEDDDDEEVQPPDIVTSGKQDSTIDHSTSRDFQTPPPETNPDFADFNTNPSVSDPTSTTTTSMDDFQGYNVPNYLPPNNNNLNMGAGLNNIEMQFMNEVTYTREQGMMENNSETKDSDAPDYPPNM